jgi:HYR domain
VSPSTPRSRFVAPAILIRTVTGLVLTMGGLLCTPGFASAAIFPATATLTPSAPALVTTASPVRADVTFGTSFSSIESICMTLSYENEVLEPGEGIDVGFPPVVDFGGFIGYQGGAVGQRAGAGNAQNTICLSGAHPQAALFLDGQQDMYVLDGYPAPTGSLVLTSFRVVLDGTPAGVPQDTTKPTLIVPGDLTVDAIGPDGASVLYSASAQDDVDGAIAPECSPASDSTFAIGSTAVTCSATDAAGNTGTAGFTVTVLGAQAQLERLAGEVIDALRLAPAIAGPLKQRLSAIIAAVSTAEKCRGLSLFIAAARVLGRDPRFADTTAELVADAERIRAVLDCR